MKKGKAKNVHMVGIAGAGMSALAVLLKHAGFKVTGSDENVFEPVAGYLRRNKISFRTGHRANNIPKNAELVIVGKHAGLSAEENPEVRRAFKIGLPVKSMPEILAELAQGKESIVVAGSFGKSTLAALTAWCLDYAKRKPSYFIGASPIDLKFSAKLGAGREFVIEGDEYPSANWDRRSKFLHFSPATVILISALHDHVNIFPTEKSYVETYKKLVAKIPRSGLLVYAKHGKNNEKIARYAKCKTISYGFEAPARQSLGVGGDWYAQNIKYGKLTSFDLCHKGKKVVKVETKLLGKHNVENIVGAAAVLLEQKKISAGVFARAVKNFKGIKRRIELKNPKGKIPVYDIFGSSYEKTRAGIEALNLHFPGKRIVAVFEPHAFSWRNKKFLPWYKNIFKGVGVVIMLPAVSRGKKDKMELDTKEIWAEAKKHFPIHTVKTKQETQKILKKIVRKGDVIALVSSGPMLGLTESVPKLF